VIWVVVFVAAFIVAGFFPDDDPTTDDSSGAGALAFVVGSVLTVIYLAVSKTTQAPRLPVRTCPSCGAEMYCEVRVCPSCSAESQPWVRHHDTWWYRSPAGWQWVDDAGIWRWYHDGTPSSGATSDMTPDLAITPAKIEPPAS